MGPSKVEATRPNRRRESTHTTASVESVAPATTTGSSDDRSRAYTHTHTHTTGVIAVSQARPATQRRSLRTNDTPMTCARREIWNSNTACTDGEPDRDNCFTADASAWERPTGLRLTRYTPCVRGTSTYLEVVVMGLAAMHRV